jgi:hypothetical protein
MRINEVLYDAVCTSDKKAVLKILGELRAKGLNGDRRRIVLSPRTPDATPS